MYDCKVSARVGEVGGSLGLAGKPVLLKSTQVKREQTIASKTRYLSPGGGNII